MKYTRVLTEQDLVAKLRDNESTAAFEIVDMDGNAILQITEDGALVTKSFNSALYLTTIAGYDAAKTQTLRNINGVFQWVDE